MATLTRRKRGQIAAYLAALETRSGRIDPAIIVEDARRPDCLVHSHFEWDDTVCGELYRLEQAEELLRSVHAEFGSDDITFRPPKYVSVPERERTYQDIIKVKQSSMLAQLTDEARRLHGTVKRVLSIAKTYNHPLAPGAASALGKMYRMSEKLLDSLES